MFIIRAIFILSLSVYFTCHAADFDRNNKIKADISFMIADIKVPQDGVKILELGDATWSGFRGFGFIHGVGAAWNLFWEHLELFNLPIFLVGTPSATEKALSRFTQNPICRNVGSMRDLVRDPLFKQLAKEPRVSISLTKTSLLAYKGIIVFDRYRSVPEHFYMAKKYPNFLILNEAIYEAAQYKHLTGKLFDTALQEFRPKFGIYDRAYSPTLAETIKHDIPVPMYVLKPTYASQGHGVIMVSSNDLDDTLKFIFQAKGHGNWKLFKLSDNDYKDAYAYWHKPTHDTSFIVEEFVASKTVLIDKKPYDPTMRVFFSLSNSEGIIGITFLGAYWKKPTKSLMEEGSFRIKHISKIPKHQPSEEIIKGLTVSCDDYKRVTEILHPVLEQLYKKMLIQNYETPNGFIARQFYREESF